MNVYAVIATDEEAKLTPVRVGVVTLVTTATTQEAVAELRRNAMAVDVVTAEVLHTAPALPVYIVSVDAAIAGVLADKIVAWGTSSELRSGLMDVADDDLQVVQCTGR